LGEAGVEELLARTVAAAVQMKAVRPAEFERVIVDTTVQENDHASVLRTAEKCYFLMNGGRNEQRESP
jgi:hypothetical protein